MTQTNAAVVRKQVIVDAAIDRAFTVFTQRFGDFKQPEHNLLRAPIAETVFEPHVGGNVVDGHINTGQPQVGDHCLTTRRSGGKNRSSTSTVTHFNPARTWGVDGIDGPIRATVDLTVEPLTETLSRLTIAVDFEGHAIGKVPVPLLVRREAQKEIPANLARLNEYLETAGRRSARTRPPDCRISE